MTTETSIAGTASGTRLVRRIRVLVVDDAVLVRRIVSDALQQDLRVEIVGTAANGRLALAKIPLVKPDLVLLDVEMPELDGPATLVEIRRQWPTLPVIMFSALTLAGAAITLDCLARGANDFVTKPVAGPGGIAAAIPLLQAELLPRIVALAGRHLLAPKAEPPAPYTAPLQPSTGVARTRVVDVVVIGVSTGGPNALGKVIPLLPATLGVPVLVVQHMPPVFTRHLAERLASNSSIAVCEAEPGMDLRPGRVAIAAGDHHLVVERTDAGRSLALNQDPPENSCRPAVDVLLRSAARVYGGRVLVVMLTGMGLDGLRGTRLLAGLGAQVIIQDEATSVVWGMPGALAKAGLAEQALPLDRIAGEIVRRVGEGRSA